MASVLRFILWLAFGLPLCAAAGVSPGLVNGPTSNIIPQPSPGGDLGRLQRVFDTWANNAAVGICDSLRKPNCSQYDNNASIACLCNGLVGPNDDGCRIIRLTVTNQWECLRNQTVPAELFELTELLQLNLSNNLLLGPLNRIGSLTKLQSLRLDSNQFTDLPAEIGDLASLNSLWAFDNNITGDLRFVGKLKNLADLRIYSIPMPIEDQIQGNFNTIDFTDLTNLKTLMLGNFAVSEESINLLDNFGNLSTLMLRDCKPPNKSVTFPTPPNLNYLDLSFSNFNCTDKSWSSSTVLNYLYLGSNKISVLPDIIRIKALSAVDISNNQGMTGYITSIYNQTGDSRINLIGTSINSNYTEGDDSRVLSCLEGKPSCTYSSTDWHTNISINCGGGAVAEYTDDSFHLGLADFRVDAKKRFVVAAVGLDRFDPFIKKKDGHIVKLEERAFHTGESESLGPLYRTARVSTSSLYYAIGLANGNYTVELHFAEIVIDDPAGRRIFDIIIQRTPVRTDFDLIAEANGAFKPHIWKTNTIVDKSVLEIHLKWAGKGTCCIPYNGTYGPLLSAIHVSPVPDVPPTPDGPFSPPPPSSSMPSEEKQRAVIFGIVSLCVAGVAISSSIAYLWWKWLQIGHIQDQANHVQKD